MIDLSATMKLLSEMEALKVRPRVLLTLATIADMPGATRNGVIAALGIRSHSSSNSSIAYLENHGLIYDKRPVKLQAHAAGYYVTPKGKELLQDLTRLREVLVTGYDL